MRPSKRFFKSVKKKQILAQIHTKEANVFIDIWVEIYMGKAHTGEIVSFC